MFLNIKNTGKISSAQIEIKGITVIAGVNDTGKSTVGRILFCLFNSFYKIDQQIEQERNNSLLISENSVQYDNMRSPGKTVHVLDVSNEEIFVAVFRKWLQDEFGMQINNIYTPELQSEISLKIRDKEVKVSIQKNEVINITDSFSLTTEAIYMDDPLALDNFNDMGLSALNSKNHKIHLKSKLLKRNSNSIVKSAIDEIVAAKKLEAVFAKLNDICKGELTGNANVYNFAWAYQDKDSKTSLDIRNVSAGIKPFAIIKTLLLNGSLTENGIIVMDEPEIHLHPEWQLVFAELIVLLQKEFNMHILLNTHSPYFLDAIEVFSQKHGIEDKCKYYLAENIDKSAVITDVSDRIEKIYEKLSEPLQILENERYRID